MEFDSGFRRLQIVGWVSLFGVQQVFSAHPDVPALARTIGAVGPEGKGNTEAAQAWRTLSRQDLQSLIPLLRSMDSVNDLAANWLRSAAETIVARELQAGAKLPVASLEEFLKDTSHSHRVRAFAHELIARADAPRAEKLLAEMLDDPGAELRRAAVDREIQNAQKLLDSGKTAQGKEQYLRLLALARDAGQIDSIAKTLRKLGEKVDIAKTFGFLTEWKIIGPFDSVGGKGFAAIYPPEQSIDFGAEYPGKSGPVRWRDFSSKDDYGNISMNIPYTALKGAAAYAYTEFFSNEDRPVELRFGTQNGFKVWFNGQYLFGHEEYHLNKAIDQYPLPARLRAGRNTILVKVCQNEQTEDWAKEWEFQLRICDPLGVPLFSAAPAKGGAQ